MFSPAWALSPVSAMCVSSTIPRVSEIDSTTPIAASGRSLPTRSSAIIANAASAADTVAPSSSVSGTAAPVSRNATATPDRVPWLIASPNMLRRRSTASGPSAPATNPTTAVPTTTTASGYDSGSAASTVPIMSPAPAAPCRRPVRGARR